MVEYVWFWLSKTPIFFSPFLPTFSALSKTAAPSTVSIGHVSDLHRCFSVCISSHRLASHFTATKTSVTVSVKQHEYDRVTRCTFSVDFKEIKTISQSLPSTCAICLRSRQGGRHRGEIETNRLSGTVNFRVWIQTCFFPNMHGIPDRHYEVTHKRAQS